MNSRQREARRVHVHPRLSYFHTDSESIGQMRIVDGRYHVIINEGMKIKASEIDHATYEVVREVDGYLAEIKILMDIPTEKVEPGMFSVEETK